MLDGSLSSHYPTLHCLERAGYLLAQPVLAEGRWRKYYAITPAGIDALAQVRAKLQELADEVLDRRPS